MKEITNNIFYVGVNDRNKTLFEGLWPLPNGVSYNAYLIVDEKVCLIDTVEVDFFMPFLENIREVIGDRPIDYVVVNHMEPDHSGSLALLRQFYPNIEIIGNKKTFDMMAGFYRLTTGLPKHITSTTGMDALTHAVEAYIGRSTTKYTREMSEKAVVLVHRYLKRAYDDGNDAEARKNMLYAAYCAGIAFTQSYVGYVHGLAHALGGQYGTPHGLANAVILPHMLRAYGSTCYKPLGKLGWLIGVASPSDDDETAANAFIAVQDNNVFIGRDNTISKLLIERK